MSKIQITTLFPENYVNYLKRLTPALMEQTVQNGMFYILYTLKKNVSNNLNNILNEVPYDKRKLSNNLSIKDNEKIVEVINIGMKIGEIKNDTQITIFVDETEYQEFCDELESIHRGAGDPVQYLLSGLLQITVIQSLFNKVFMPQDIVKMNELSNKYSSLLHFISTKVLLPITISLKKLTDFVESKRAGSTKDTNKAKPD
jgi:hypothetical protein